MVNKPKQIGTFAETGVLKAILPYYPHAKRLALAGAQDKGDLDTGDGMKVMFEVKGGKQCAQIGDGKLAKWMGETDAERDHLGKQYGFLVVQRAGFGQPNAHRWWAYVHLGDLAQITGGYYPPGRFAVARLELQDLLGMLADNDLTADLEAPLTDIVLDPDVPEGYAIWKNADGSPAAMMRI